MQLDTLESEQAALAALAATADPGLPVPACPGWTVAALVAHVAAVHRWAAAAVALDAGSPLPDDAPFERAATQADYPAAAAHLRAALADATRACPTLSGTGTAAWWVRRQVHETFVHRLDLAAALGVEAMIDAAVATDCVSEVLDTMQPRQVRLRRMRPLTSGVVLHAEGRVWHLGPNPVAQVSGNPSALALLLWRRASLDDTQFTVTGDRHAAAAVLTQPLTP